MSLTKLLAVAAVLATAPALGAASGPVPDDTTYPPAGAWTPGAVPGALVTEDVTYPGAPAGAVARPLAPATASPLLADDTAYPGPEPLPARGPESRGAVEALAACGCGRASAG